MMQAFLIFFQTFAIFCGLGVHNCQLYENVCKLMARQKVAIEVLAFHAMANIDDTEKLVVLILFILFIPFNFL